MRNKTLVFIPMYNCENQIGRVIDQFKGEIKSYIDEIIIINNRSTDNGEKVVLEKLKKLNIGLPIKLLKNDENYGLGGSHKVAFKYAIENNFDYIIILHGDDQGNINDILPYLKNKEYQKYDSFLGARFMKKSRIIGYSKFRTFGNKVYNLIFSIFLRKKIFDLGSGLNCYRVDVLRNNYYHKFPDSLLFNYCMIIASSYYKQNIKFFPISWREEDQVSNVKMMNQALKVLKYLFSYVLNKKEIVEKDFRDKEVKNYTAKEIKN
nr:glycosyltransferase family 2 protein [uncultured Leptotrichia sp.]